METTLDRVRRVVTKHWTENGILPEGGDLADDKNMFDIGGDSLDYVELIVALEDEFGVELQIDGEFSTITEIATFLEGLNNGSHI